VYGQLKPLIQKECPFETKPKTDTPATWVEPKLVCEVSFGAWTSVGIMLYPVFLGLRPDKAPKEVHREQVIHTDQLVAPRPRAAARGASTNRLPSVGVEMSMSANSSAGVTLTIDDHPVNLTNLNKVFWPGEGITKGDVIHYYRSIAPVLLPYLRDRPMSLNRHPNGIDKPNFFQKNAATQRPPAWVQTAPIPSDHRQGGIINYLVCQDEATLAYIANLGCIEINPWQSRVGSLDRPDFLILDLDPQDLPFECVVEAAQAIRSTLEDLGAVSCCKTSGKRGLHICVPLEAQYEYEAARQFAELIARVVYSRLPETTSLARMPAQRRHKVYLDFGQNGRGQTLASVYSLRPQPGAPVSTPLAWREVRRGLDPTRFTIKTTLKRLDKVGDLWAPVLGKGINLGKCLERLAEAVQQK
jgi:bifunctional non-homologous end joining protein LigD